VKGYDDGIALNIFEAIPEGFEKGEVEFVHYGVLFRLIDVPDDDLIVHSQCMWDHPWSQMLLPITVDFFESYFSETTNNDACELGIKLKSHHHADGYEGVRVTVELLDYLT
jgi:hypothetical protein